MEEIQNELKEIKRMMKDVSYQMQELRESLRGTSVSASMLPMPKPYEHPWWQYQRVGPVTCGDNHWEQVETTTDSSNETRLRVSGTTKAA
jgi:hypothetical protein